MATDTIQSVVTAVNGSQLNSLTALFSPETAASVKDALTGLASTAKGVKYTVNQTVTEGTLVAFTYSATGTSTATNKAGSWTGSGVATLDGGVITALQVHEDTIAKAIVLGESLTTVAHPTAAGTWTGSASGFTVTLKLTQSGTKVTGTVAITGFPGTFPATGENNYPHNPNVVINATVVGLETEFEGDFDGANKIDGTLKIPGFSPIDVTVNKQA
jgi:hypothetical protein